MRTGGGSAGRSAGGRDQGAKLAPRSGREVGGIESPGDVMKPDANAGAQAAAAPAVATGSKPTSRRKKGAAAGGDCEQVRPTSPTGDDKNRCRGLGLAADFLSFIIIIFVVFFSLSRGRFSHEGGRDLRRAVVQAQAR